MHNKFKNRINHSITDERRKGELNLLASIRLLFCFYNLWIIQIFACYKFIRSFIVKDWKRKEASERVYSGRGPKDEREGRGPVLFHVNGENDYLHEISI